MTSKKSKTSGEKKVPKSWAAFLGALVVSPFALPISAVRFGFVKVRAFWQTPKEERSFKDLFASLGAASVGVLATVGAVFSVHKLVAVKAAWGWISSTVLVGGFSTGADRIREYFTSLWHGDVTPKPGPVQTEPDDDVTQINLEDSRLPSDQTEED